MVTQPPVTARNRILDRDALWIVGALSEGPGNGCERHGALSTSRNEHVVAPAVPAMRPTPDGLGGSERGSTAAELEPFRVGRCAVTFGRRDEPSVGERQNEDDADSDEVEVPRPPDSARVCAHAPMLLEFGQSAIRVAMPGLLSATARARRTERCTSRSHANRNSMYRARRDGCRVRSRLRRCPNHWRYLLRVWLRLRS